MIRLLIKKQFLEIFRATFYNRKQGKRRSKTAVIAAVILFGVLLLGVIGGGIAMMLHFLWAPLSAAGMGWLFYLLLGVIALLFGTFASVFNTFSALYLGKDNDLLFALPIPVDAIIASRLLTVYLMGLLYSGTMMLPSLIYTWVQGATFSAVVGGLLLLLVISVLDLALSCALGYVIARISLKIRNRGLVSAIGAVVFLGAYYFFYFKLMDFIRTFAENAARYGAQVRSSFRPAWLFGRMGEGDWLAIAIWVAASAALLALVWWILRRSFWKIAASTAPTKKKAYREKRATPRGASAALLGREFRRLGSSANYMLNCCFGVLLLPLAGGALLWKGRTMMELFGAMIGPENTAFALCAVLCMMATMVDAAAPSVSLEGKQLWLVKSMPVSAWSVLRAKLWVQLLLSELPILFADACAVAICARYLTLPAGTLILLAVLPLLLTLFFGLWDLFWGIRFPNLNWTSEIYPIKQSMPVTMALLGGWAIVIVFGVLWFLLGRKLGLTPWLAIAAAFFALASLALYRWLKTRGAARFEAL